MKRLLKLAAITAGSFTGICLFILGWILLGATVGFLWSLAIVSALLLVAAFALNQFAQTGKAKNAGRKIATAVFSVLAIVGITYSGAWLIGGAENNGNDDTQVEEKVMVEFDSIRAWQSVQNDVKNQLKAPSTAKLSSYGNSTVKKHATEPNTYVIRGYVDAQNSFGAMLRQEYVATVVFFPNGGTYLPIDIQFIQ